MTAAKTQLYVRSSTKTLNARKNPLNLLSRGKRDFLEQCKNICMQNIEKKVSLEYKWIMDILFNRITLLCIFEKSYHKITFFSFLKFIVE